MYRILLILLTVLLPVSANSFPVNNLELNPTTETYIFHCDEISYVPPHYDTEHEAEFRKIKGIVGDMVVYVKVHCDGEILFVDGFEKELLNTH